MGAKSFAISKGATPSITGGTAINFADDGQTVSNGVHCVNSGATDVRLQESVTLKTRRPTLKDGKFISKDKRSWVYSKPYLLADGTITYGVFRGEVELHPDVTSFATEQADLRKTGCQLMFDAELETFNLNGSTA